MTDVKGEYRRLLGQFLHDVSFRMPDYGQSPSIEDAVVDYFESQGFDAEFITRAGPAIKASCIIATTTYPFVSIEIQRVIGIYTTFAICIDDITNVSTADLKGFLDRLCRSEPQPNLLLRDMLRFIAEEIPKFYGPFAGDMIRKSIIEFTCACVVENEYHGEVVPARTAPDFPYYFRHKTGMAEAYAFFAFPETLAPEKTAMPVYLPVIPDLVRYFNPANDLLSFYKESVVGEERFNYIYNHAQYNGIGPLESLRSTATDVTRCIHNAKTTFSGTPTLSDAVTQVFHGYIVYHWSSSRYRLSELDPQA
ncbi:terpenoid synthase [Aspergillus egyptiacus]|nr:terpenoid synthase [Aspergillus egyptiacus]